MLFRSPIRRRRGETRRIRRSRRTLRATSGRTSGRNELHAVRATLCVRSASGASSRRQRCYATHCTWQKAPWRWFWRSVTPGTSRECRAGKPAGDSPPSCPAPYIPIGYKRTSPSSMRPTYGPAEELSAPTPPLSSSHKVSARPGHGPGRDGEYLPDVILL